MKSLARNEETMGSAPTCGPALRKIRLDLSELSGALGDLGTFLPLALGLIAVNGLNPTSVFLSAGLL